MPQAPTPRRCSSEHVAWWRMSRSATRLLQRWPSPRPASAPTEQDRRNGVRLSLPTTRRVARPIATPHVVVRRRCVPRQCSIAWPARGEALRQQRPTKGVGARLDGATVYPGERLVWFIRGLRHRYDAQWRARSVVAPVRHPLIPGANDAYGLIADIRYAASRSSRQWRAPALLKDVCMVTLFVGADAVGKGKEMLFEVVFFSER